MQSDVKYLAVSTVGIRALGLNFSGISEFLTMSFQCFHWPLALKSKTKSKTRPSAGGNASNLLFKAGGIGSSADLEDSNRLQKIALSLLQMAK